MPTKSKLDIYRDDLRARVKEAHAQGNYLNEEDERMLCMLIEMWSFSEREEDPTDLENRIADFEEAVTHGLIDLSTDETVELPSDEEGRDDSPDEDDCAPTEIKCRTFELP